MDPIALVATRVLDQAGDSPKQMSYSQANDDRSQNGHIFEYTHHWPPSLLVSLTEEQVTNLLFDYIDKSTFQAGSNLDKFMQLAVQLDTADGKALIEAKYTLKKAIDARVVYEKQGAYNWNKQDGLIILGETLAETLAFLLNPKKQVLVDDLEKEIKAKTAY